MTSGAPALTWYNNTVALGLEEQLLPEGENVPCDVTDYKLDALITGDGQILRADKLNPAQ
jgi:hypothetical protein